MYLSLFVGVLSLSLFCYALLCVHSSFATILKKKRNLVALLLLSYRCIVTLNAHGAMGLSEVCDRGIAECRGRES